MGGMEGMRGMGGMGGGTTRVFTTGGTQMGGNSPDCHVQ